MPLHPPAHLVSVPGDIAVATAEASFNDLVALTSKSADSNSSFVASLKLQKDANTKQKKRWQKRKGESNRTRLTRTKRKMLEIQCSVSLVKETVSYIAINY
ncbi:hypothetical protein CBL_01132 [Carabus blaptoides fortunei]